MNLPSQEQSEAYFQQYDVPGNIKAHCFRVRSVACCLAWHLAQAGISIDVDFVGRLALFHDLFKAVALPELKPNEFHSYVYSQSEIAMWKKLREKYPQMYEGEIAYQVFKDDYPELALALRNVSNPRAEQTRWEEKLVHYADWRVFQEQIVSLKERAAYLRRRYPREDEVWERYEDKIRRLEKEIFTHLSFSPEQLSLRLDSPQEKMAVSKMAEALV